MRPIAVAVVVLWGAAALSAQNTARAAFEVATVKPSPPNPPRFRLSDVPVPPPGHWLAQRATLVQLIHSAYPMYRFHALVAGGPSWVREAIFDVEGLMDPKTTPMQAAPMVAALLRDRFGLRFHTEQRLLPVYVLKLARPDGQLGPKLTHSAEPCVQARIAGQSIPTECRGFGFLIQVDEYLQYLSARRLDRPVIDRSGLKGYFDFRLTWSCGPFESSAPCAGDAVSLFTALQEQAGLKLQPAREMVDVMVIDSVSMPEPD